MSIIDISTLSQRYRRCGTDDEVDGVSKTDLTSSLFNRSHKFSLYVRAISAIIHLGWLFDQFVDYGHDYLWMEAAVCGTFNRRSPWIIHEWKNDYARTAFCHPSESARFARWMLVVTTAPVQLMNWCSSAFFFLLQMWTRLINPGWFRRVIQWHRIKDVQRIEKNFALLHENLKEQQDRLELIQMSTSRGFDIGSCML